MEQDHPYRVGVAVVDITPSSPCELSGFIARQNPAIGVHDPVFVRALTIENGHATVALLTCDLLGLEAATVATMRQRIAAATGIPAAYIMLAASHTHSAPASMFLNGCGTVDPDWFAALPDSFVAATAQALAAAQSARFGAGSVAVDGVSMNRRAGNGPVDPDLQVLSAERVNGEPLALLLTYSCHPVTPGAGNRLISADFPGALTRQVEARTGAVVLYGTGACADINPARLSKEPTERASDFELVEEIGVVLADGAMSVLPRLVPTSGTHITVSSRTLALPFLAAPTEAELSAFDATQQHEMAAESDTGSVRYRNAAAMCDWVARTRQ